MATRPLTSRGLKLQPEERANETIIHCNGKITAESSDLFQREIRAVIPESRGEIAYAARSAKKQDSSTLARHPFIPISATSSEPDTH